MSDFDESYKEIGKFLIEFRKYLKKYNKRTKVNMRFLLYTAMPIVVGKLKDELDKNFVTEHKSEVTKMLDGKPSASYSIKRGEYG